MASLAVNLPVVSKEAGLTSYMQMIKKFPLLSAKEELDLANSLHASGDIKAAHKLVTSQYFCRYILLNLGKQDPSA